MDDGCEPTQNPVPTKIGFSFGKVAMPPPRRVEQPRNDDQPRDYVTEFRDGQLVSSNPKPKKEALVIPISDGWVIPPDEKVVEQPRATIQEEIQPPEAPPGPVETNNEIADIMATNTYGLIESKSRKPKPQADNGSKRAVPLLMQNKPPGWHDIENEEEKFKHELKYRPAESQDEDYERVPVEDFGEALLRGMGWQPGTAVGKGGPTEVVEFVRRHHRLGLGAQPKVEEPPSIKDRKKIIKPGESRDPKPTMIYKDKDGRIKHVKSLDDKLVEYKPKVMEPGARVFIVSGPHDGMSAIIERMTPNSVIVRLETSEELLAVDRKDLVLDMADGTEQNHPLLGNGGRSVAASSSARDLDDRRDRDRDGDDRRSDKKRDRDDDREDYSSSSKRSKSDRDDIDDRSSHSRHHHHHHSDRDHLDRDRDGKHRDDDRHKMSSSSSHHHHHHHNSSGNSSSSKKTERIWVRPDIRVRVRNKKLKDGKFYCKKAKIIDVISGSTCDIRLEDGGALITVDQHDLETVLPPVGGRVVVVRGEHKNAVGSLLLRDSDRNVAQVQLVEDLSLIKLSMDDVAEYQG